MSMSLIRVDLKSGGFEELLNSSEVRALVTDHAEDALGSAKASAPVDSGDYRDSLHIEQATTDRAVARVVADVPYALQVEAKHGTLARSLR